MAWFILFLAGLFEVAWAVGMKYSEGFSRLVPSLITAVCMALSVWLLSISMKTLPLGTAYAVWTGIGAIGAVIVGIIIFKEPMTALRIGSACLIVLGLLGLKLSAS